MVDFPPIEVSGQIRPQQIDEEKSKVGYEIPFNRHFYVFESPRSLHAIDEELKAATTKILAALGELAE